jgi:uncharacterized protein YodC (DUF2158 family)
MRPTDFVPGETVRLKSGGLIMTIEKVEGETVTCVWTLKGKVMREIFVATALQKATRAFAPPSW